MLKLHTINVYCQGFCSNGIIARHKEPILTSTYLHHGQAYFNLPFTTSIEQEI